MRIFENNMRIALLGDIALFGRCTDPNCFKNVGSYLANFDFVVGNLETPFSAKKQTNGAKSAYICAEPSCVAILKELHLNAVTLANNHMFDYGKEGYELTKMLLDEADIAWFGTEGKELLVEKNGNKIVFSGYCCYSSNPLCCVPDGGYGVNAYDVNAVRSRIREHNEDGFLNIVAVHAGIEHVNYPSLDHVRAARLLAEECPYVYYGHHPHVIQGVEEYKGALIAHSLGNFCFDDVYGSASANEPLVVLNDNNRIGVVLELTVKGNKVTAWKEQLIHIGKEDGVRLVNAEDKVFDYNYSLEHCEDNPDYYEQMRESMIKAWSLARKEKRNLSWYVKRMRLRYVKLLFDMRKNTKFYNLNVKRYLF